MITCDDLIEKVKKYLASPNEKLIIKAYQFAIQAHSNQFRSSGEPYFSHPLAVAEILIDLKLDTASIITALLHDTVEDTSIKLDEIERLFGEEIASLVDGVTKLGKIENYPAKQRTAENFRKLVMAMSQDIRVLLVKLADRLHNMRTIDFIPSETRRIRIASESLTIYAPLAARIGMYQIRDELQELSFTQIQPTSRSYIVEKLSELKEREKDIIEKIIDDLRLIIKNQGVDFEIYGREKKPYSIWLKMKNKNVSFHHIHDIIGFRIIVNNIPDCYRVLGIINCNYNMIPNTFQDYISTPKENSYQSIHLAILGPQNKKIEIQIRTKEMHETSELGVAAHWSYKENSKNSNENEKYKWIRELINLFEQAEDPSEILQNHKIQIHKDQVFCFTPDGDVFNLPVGSTIIDFAYAIHSEIGNRCFEAKVNGTVTPLRQKLQNGDQIEIITSQDAKPSPNWLQFATTSKAKVAIKHFIRNEKHNEYSSLGRAIINKFFASRGLEINDKILEKVVGNFNKKSVDDLYIFIAEGLISRQELLRVVYPEFYEEENKRRSTRDSQDKKKNSDHSMPINGLIPGMAIHFSGCCNPIPGDKIIGIINVGIGVTIHNQLCSNIKSIAINPQRLIDVCWIDDTGDEFYHSRIMIRLKNKSGSLAELTNIIAQKKVNITNLRIVNRSKDFFELIIDIEVKNVDHLGEILSTLQISDQILEISRWDVSSIM